MRTFPTCTQLNRRPLLLLIEVDNCICSVFTDDKNENNLCLGQDFCAENPSRKD